MKAHELEIYNLQYYIKNKNCHCHDAMVTLNWVVAQIAAF